MASGRRRGGPLGKGFFRRRPGHRSRPRRHEKAPGLGPRLAARRWARGGLGRRASGPRRPRSAGDGPHGARRTPGHRWIVDGTPGVGLARLLGRLRSRFFGRPRGAGGPVARGVARRAGRHFDPGRVGPSSAASGLCRPGSRDDRTAPSALLLRNRARRGGGV